MAGTSPENIVSPTQNQSSPFSIMDILSDEVGQKKSPTSRHNIPLSTPGSSTGVSKLPCRSMFSQENANQMRQVSSETPKRPRKSSSSHFSSRAPMITLSEAGSIVGPGTKIKQQVPCNLATLQSVQSGLISGLRMSNGTILYRVPYRNLSLGGRCGGGRGIIVDPNY